MHLKWDIFLTHLTARDNQVAVSSPQRCVGFLFLILYPGLLVLRLLLPSWWRAWAGLVVFWRRGTLRGRRGTISHPPSFRVAGVAQSHIHFRFTWQAWQKLSSTVVARGRRSTNEHPLSFCVAGVAPTHIHLRFAWQVWHTWHWVALLVWFGRRVTPWQAWHNLTYALAYLCPSTHPSPYVSPLPLPTPLLYTALHYITLHYTTLHCLELYYSTLYTYNTTCPHTTYSHLLFHARLNHT